MSEELTRAAHRVLMGSFPGPVVPGWLLRRLDAGLGSVCLFGSNLTGTGEGPDGHVRAVTGPLLDAAPDLVVAIDEEGGDVTRFDALTGGTTPGALALGAVDDPELTRGVAAGIGARLRAAGVRLDLAPVADVNADPRNPVIGVRSFGADPELVARHVAAAVAGLRSAGVASCVKHFPGHGDTAEDSHVGLPTLAAPLELLRRRELPPFAAAIAAGTEAVMLGHLVVPALDPHRPSSTSPAVVALLRELGFDGVVVTDALDMAGASAPYGGEPGAAVAALAAGCDLLCLGSEFDDERTGAVVAAILAAVREGRLPAERLLGAAAGVEALRFPEPVAVQPVDAMDVARRALDVSGSLPDLAGALVVEAPVIPNVAVGAVPWGIAARLAARLPGIEGLTAGPADDPSAVAAKAGGRPLVLVTRDAGRHGWVAALLAQLAASRPDLVLVETGWPAGPATTARVLTRGASAVGLDAAADLLAGTGR